MTNVETYDEYIAQLVNSHDQPVPIFDIRMTTRQGWDWYCGDCNSHNIPLNPPVPTFIPAGPYGPNITGIENASLRNCRAVYSNHYVCKDCARNKCL